MKLLKIISVNDTFYEKFGDVEKNHLKHWSRKFGNIKDPKGGTRPYLLFSHDDDKNSKIFWVVPSTSSINKKTLIRIKQNDSNYFVYLKFYNFNLLNKGCIFEFLNMHPITTDYFVNYKISYFDKSHKLYGSEDFPAISNSFLKQIINTNYKINNQINILEKEIEISSNQWKKIIKKIENQALLAYNKISKKFINVKIRDIKDILIKELEK